MADQLLLIDSAQKRHEMLRLKFNTAVWDKLYRRDFLEKNEIVFPEHLPYEVLNEMKRTVLAGFPDYKNSDIYPKLNDLERGLLEPLEVEMTNERWDMLAHNYRFVLKNAENLH